MDRRHSGPAFFAYATNYLIDTQHAVILDVEATRAVRQAEVGAARTMLERTAERFGLKPQHLAADSAYGSADNLAWLVKEKKIAPHIPVIDKATVLMARSHAPTSCLILRGSLHLPGWQTSGAVSPQLHEPALRRHQRWRRFYRAKQSDCQSCDLKVRCCPNTPRRRVPRGLDEDARDVARALAGTPAFERSRHPRKKIEMLFAHLKRILRLARLRLRGPCGARMSSCWRQRRRT